MPNSSEKTEVAPPSYTSCVVTDNVPLVSPVSPGLDQFIRIVDNHETLHFHSPNGMGYCTVPEVVQIRDAAERPILSVMTGRNRTVAREIMTPSGEALIAVSGGNKSTLSAGDQVLGIIEDDSLLCRQTLKAKNVMGDVIFNGIGDHNDGDGGSGGCCLECGFGFCTPNSTEVTFCHNGATLGQLKRSTNNSSGNELILFNPANMDPRTKALIIYASYSAYLMFFVETKCGRNGDRGVGRRFCLILIIVSLFLMSLPFLRFFFKH